MHLQQERRRPCGRQQRGEALHGTVPRPGGRWRSSRSGSISGGAGSPRRPPRLSCRWNRTARSRAGSISSSGSVRRRPATTLAWPTSRQRPTAGEEIRFAIVRRIIGVNERASGPGKTGARFSRAMITPRRSAPGGERGQRAGLGQPAILAGGLVGQVGGVVDDVRGPDLGGVGDQPLDRVVALLGSGPHRTGAVEHGAEPEVPRPRTGPRRGGARPGGLTRTDGGGEGTWTKRNPAASISFSIGAAGHQS